MRGVSEPLLHADDDDSSPDHTTGAYLTLRDMEDGDDEAANKLGTVKGVLVPCSLNVCGVVIFLRLGWIVGQAGFIGALSMLCLAYLAVLLTHLSMCAIVTNGTMKGGGTYYLVSRALGPEFGGSIGLMFYIACLASTSFFLLGTGEAAVATFDLGESRWVRIGIASAALLVLVSVALGGTAIYAKATMATLVIVMSGLLSAFIGFFVRAPGSVPGFTGISGHTLNSNMQSSWSVDGGVLYDFRAVFAILFPATTGLLSGPNLSGDLRNPSKSLPKGTGKAMLITYTTFLSLIVLYASSVTRPVLISDKYLMQHITPLGWLVTLALFTAIVSSGMGNFIGAGKVLQAIARDDIIPLLKPFGRGFGPAQEPRFATLLSWALVQGMLMAGSVNAIAPFASMFFLLSFCFINVACMFLSATGAPNWRPTFVWFSTLTAALGSITTAGLMVYIDFSHAAFSTGILLCVFFYIHFQAPAARWGDISQALIYHQVRKYLLRLDARKDHVKFWRPQVLLLVAHPRTALRLIDFANNLKKGGLYVLGNVVIGEHFNTDVLRRVQRESNAWMQLIEATGIKAFHEVTVATSVAQGASQLTLTAGLGGMKPNTIIVGFHHSEGPPREHEAPQNQAIRQAMEAFGPVRGGAPPLSVTDFIGLLRNLATLRKNVLVARSFDRLDKQLLVAEMLQPPPGHRSSGDAAVAAAAAAAAGAGAAGQSPASVAAAASAAAHRVSIDAWQVVPDGDYPSAAASLAMVLMYASTLLRTDVWRKYARLRVLTFVETLDQVEYARRHLTKVLAKYRIQASIMVFCLADARVEEYDTLLREAGAVVNGNGTVVLPSAAGTTTTIADAAASPHLDRRDTNGDGTPGLASRHASPAAASRDPTPVLDARAEGAPTIHVQEATPLDQARDLQRPAPPADGGDDDDDEETSKQKELQRAASSLAGRHGVAAARAPMTFFPRTFGEFTNRISSRVLTPRTGGDSTPPAMSSTTPRAKIWHTLDLRTRYRIINAMVRKYSSDSAALFLPLSAPPEKANDQADIMYYELLDLLSSGLPPTMLVHGPHNVIATEL